jgi:signal transduction histidine kinase/ligand-binding sensor domain-containing protein
MTRVALLVLFSLSLCLAFYPSFRSRAAVNEDGEQSRPSGLHLWGAVTLFHGLPSEAVRAVAQDQEGAMWFGTDAGLARYDGRRTQTVAGEGLAGRRVNALRAAPGGALWVGTDRGAFVRASAASPFQLIAETEGKRVTAVAADAPDRALAATADGFVFECLRQDDGRFRARPLAPRLTAAQGKGQPLELTAVALSGGRVFVGARGRGLMTLGAAGAFEEVTTRPRAFFVEAIEAGAGGPLLVGAQTSANDSGLFKVEAAKPARLEKLSGAATGTVTAVASAPGGETYAATDGRGAFRFDAEGRAAERFTFAGTAGGLRSDRVHAVHVDREGVVWFGTDRGVCRYDPRGVRVERLSAEGGEAGFVRVLFRASRGHLLAGTGRGLYARDETSRSWRAIEELRGKAVHSIAEDARGRVLVGTASGLFVGLQTEGRAAAPLKFETGGAGTEKRADAKGDAPVGGAGGQRAGESSSEEGPRTDAASAPEEPRTQTNDVAEKPSAGEAAKGGDAPVEEGEARKSAAPALTGSVRAVALFRGAVYVATYGRGLERFDGSRGRALVWPRDGEDARGREAVSLFADEAAGRLWVGTANAGVFYFDGAAVRADAALGQLSDATVWGVGAADEHLWLATGRGLFVRRPDGRLVTVAPGEDARAVVALPSRDGAPRAWCGTAAGGVLRVALDPVFGAVTSRLDAEQGLPAPGAFALLAPPTEGAGAGAGEGGDAFLVGTTRGVALYEASRLAPSVRLARVTAARAYQPEEMRGGPLRLDYPQNGLVAEVEAGASRTFPEQFRYAFALEDARGRVVRQLLTHDPRFQTEGLEAGRYSLTARAYSLDLVPSAPLRFEFEVARAPLPLTTVALSVLLGLALVALVWGYRQHRRLLRGGAELREANRQLAAARLQLANEAEAERRRIARDLHDQTLADLRRLLLLTDEMQRGGLGATSAAAAPARAPRPAPGVVGAAAGAPAPPELANARAADTPLDPLALRAEIEAISQEVRRICEDLSPSVLENVGFAAALEWALASARAHLPAECQFAYEFDCEENLEERLRLAPGEQMQVYRIVQEAVNNVCRHAGAARVALSARVDGEGAFVLTLADDGRGFDPADRKKKKEGRGLAGIRARAALIEAEVSWEKRPPEEGGTLFVLRKPEAERRKDDSRHSA